LFDPPLRGLKMSFIIELSLIAGLLAIDDRAGWQSLLAQPVFTGSLVGLLIGEVYVGVAVGLVLEIIWLSILPMRGQRRPDQVAGAVVGAGTAGLLLQLTGDPRLLSITAVGILAGLLTGELAGRVLSPFNRLKNSVLSGTDFATASRVGAKLLGLQLSSLVYIFVVEVLIVFTFLSFSLNVSERITGAVSLEGSIGWLRLLPVVGAASLIHLYWQQSLKRVLVLCTVLTVLVLWIT